MAFPSGASRRIVWKQGEFDGCYIVGHLVQDANGNKGWYVQFAGLDSGWFAIVDGRPHHANQIFFGGPNGELDATVGEMATIGESEQLTINDAIKQWELELG
jgi:hypothetical protein